MKSAIVLGSLATAVGIFGLGIFAVGTSPNAPAYAMCGIVAVILGVAVLLIGIRMSQK